MSSDAVPILRRQVDAFRIRRHHLARRAPRAQLLSATADICGAQAQLLLAAQMSIRARVRGVRATALDEQIWNRRTLVKAWCMRRTLFLLPSRDLAVFVRGSARRAEREITWMRGKGVPLKPLEELLAAAVDALDHPLTRAELAQRLSRTLGLRLGARRGGGWGSSRAVPCLKWRDLTLPIGYLLHLVGARGVVCSGPNRGSETTYVRADAWLPRWRDSTVESAERELLRRYLRAFGPSIPSDFSLWSGVRLTDVRATWAKELPNLVRVDVEGSEAWLLRRDLAELETAESDRLAVSLLPYFDTFLLSGRDRSHLVARHHQGQVFRPQGWIYPTVLVDGRVGGVWSHSRSAGRLKVRVRPFTPFSPAVSERIREEVSDLGHFLGDHSTTVEID